VDDEKAGEKKAIVSAWMCSKGWLVTEQLYHERLSLHAWRSAELGTPVITLWITRNVLDDHTAEGLFQILERLRADVWLRGHPEYFTIIRTSASCEPEIIQLAELPKEKIH
jgi:hypothetical protein